jgi:hypothetical protein
MPDATNGEFCALMDAKVGTQHCGAMAREVLARWKCMYVEVGGDEIRRYRNMIYTRWRNGAFVAYVDVAEGAAAFAGGTVKEKKGDGDVPFFTEFYSTKKEIQNMANAEWGVVDVIDYDGLRYNNYVDYYNYGKSTWAVCDHENNFIQEIEKPGMHPYGMMENPRRTADLNIIKAAVMKHEKELDDLEFGYLEAQRKDLKSKITKTNDKATKEQLKAFKKQVKDRMQRLRPVEKSGGLLGLFTGSQANGDRVRLLLDEFQQLNAL